jgi:hypothetical protein
MFNFKNLYNEVSTEKIEETSVEEEKLFEAFGNFSLGGFGNQPCKEWSEKFPPCDKSIRTTN